MHFFYSSVVQHNEIVLGEAESNHASKVLRLNQGSLVQVVDGSGTLYRGEILVVHPRKCRIKILNAIHGYGKLPYNLHVAIAPTKSMDRFEWFLEKATEIGIHEITPLLCDHSERKVVKPDRMEKILVAAMKQSGKAYLPKIHPLTPFDAFIRNAGADQPFIAHCYPGEKPHINTVLTPKGFCLILIGPEGDFSQEEVKTAKSQGFREISLGESRLRTETAGIVACIVVHLLHV